MLFDGIIQRILLDQKNRALIWGGFGSVNKLARPGLARLLPDGSLDSSYLAIWNFGPIQRFALEDGNSALIWFENDTGLTLARVTQEGSIDPNFKPFGGANPPAALNFIAPAPHGKVLVSTTALYGSGLVSRLNPDGSPDESFLSGTYTIAFSPGGWGSSYSLTPEPSGNLLVKGDVLAVNGQHGSGLLRLRMDAPTPRIEVDASSAYVVETNGLVSVKLVRNGDISAPFTVNWATDGGSALPGVDFVTTSGSVTFGVGESDHSISLRLLDNAFPDGDRTVRLRVMLPNGESLPAVSFTILNDDLGFVPGGSYAFPNGRFLMNVTGNLTRTNVRIEVSTNLRDWGEWMQMPNDSQVINRDASSDTQLFYRLVSE
ncbi:MAG: hypothetical protein EXS31_10270 [Pedosphaera sp.]|nr:hypothetical protein [Pedosphaera sp.]